MILLVLVAVAGLQPPEVSDQQIEFLRLSYKSNKDAFTFGTFHFDYTRGACASPTDAEAGVFTRAVNERGLYLFDGTNARYELIADPKDLAAATTWIGERKRSSLAGAYRTLTDGKERSSTTSRLTSLTRISFIVPISTRGQSCFTRKRSFNFHYGLATEAPTMEIYLTT